MPVILKVYLLLLTTFLLWQVLSELFEKDQSLGFIQWLFFILFPCVVLGVGKYIDPKLIQILGGWSTFVTVYLTTGVSWLSLITVASFFIPENQEVPEPVKTQLDTEGANGHYNLDGDQPIPEDLALESGKKIGEIFSPNSSITNKLMALAKLDDSIEDQEDENEGVSIKEKVSLTLATVLFIPAMILNYLA